MKSACPQTSYFPQDHTGEHIAEALQEALKSWNLNQTGLVAVTTDNRTNVVKALQLTKWPRMDCFCHKHHLAIGECNIELINLNKKIYDMQNAQ